MDCGRRSHKLHSTGGWVMAGGRPGRVGNLLSLHNASSVWETNVTGWSWVQEMQLRDRDTALTIN